MQKLLFVNDMVNLKDFDEENLKIDKTFTSKLVFIMLDMSQLKKINAMRTLIA